MFGAAVPMGLGSRRRVRLLRYLAALLVALAATLAGLLQSGVLPTDLGSSAGFAMLPDHTACEDEAPLPEQTSCGGALDEEDMQWVLTAYRIARLPRGVLGV